MKFLVIYHAGCSDGFCAAWLFHKAFPEADFHAAHYGTPPPDVAGKDVYIVDFSYKRDVMLRIIDQARRVCVLDHHKTAEEDLALLPSCSLEEWVSLKGKVRIQFDRSKSGGRLAWELRATWLGGTTMLRRVRAVGYDTFRRRPTLTTWDKIRIACHAVYR